MKHDPNITILEPDGSTIETIHTQRSAKVYAVFENEMEAMALMGVIASAAFSFCAACSSFAFALYLEAQLSPEATPEGQLLLQAGPWVGGALALLAALIGVVAWRKRGTMLDRIRRESQTRMQ